MGKNKRLHPPPEPRCDICDRQLGPKGPKEEAHPDDPYRFNVEAHLFTGLKDHGCVVIGDIGMDGDHKIDILVLNIRGWKGKFPFPLIPLQITAGQDVAVKIDRFFEEAAKWRRIEGLSFVDWPSVGALLYIEVIGYVSHYTIRALKGYLEKLAHEVEESRKPSPRKSRKDDEDDSDEKEEPKEAPKPPLQRRIRIYQNGDIRELPPKPPSE